MPPARYLDWGRRVFSSHGGDPEWSGLWTALQGELFSHRLPKQPDQESQADQRPQCIGVLAVHDPETKMWDNGDNAADDFRLGKIPHVGFVVGVALGLQRAVFVRPYPAMCYHFAVNVERYRLVDLVFGFVDDHRTCEWHRRRHRTAFNDVNVVRQGAESEETGNCC